MLLFQVRTFEDIYKKFKDHVSLSIPWKQLKQKWHQTAQRHLQNLYAGERYRSWDEAALRFFQVAKSANSVLASLPLTLKEKQNYFARLPEWVPQHPLSAEERPRGGAVGFPGPRRGSAVDGSGGVPGFQGDGRGGAVGMPCQSSMRSMLNPKSQLPTPKKLPNPKSKKS